MGFKEAIQELKRRGLAVISLDGKETMSAQRFLNHYKKHASDEVLDMFFNWDFTIFEKGKFLPAQLIGIPRRMKENTSATFWTMNLREL